MKKDLTENMNNWHMVGVKMSDQQLEFIKKIASKETSTKSQVVRDAINFYMRAIGKEK